MADQDISNYDKLLSRRSIRTYKPLLIGDDVFNQIEGFFSTAFPIDSDNQFKNKIFVYQSDSIEGKALSRLGRIMNPPYFMAPHIYGDSLPLVDLWFRTQQIVFQLWRLGIGSCYIGCAHKKDRVVKTLELQEKAKMVSFVVFGYPDDTYYRNAYQKITGIFMGNRVRLLFDELFIGNALPDFLVLNQSFVKIIEAGRFAPSATNSQPWRFAVSNGQFIICARHKKIAKIYDLQQGYSLHDTGICMANMSLAAKALGLTINWKLSTNELKMPFDTKFDTPIACFSLQDIGIKHDQY